MVGPLLKKSDAKKKQILISGTCNHKAKIELKKMNAINFLLIWESQKGNTIVQNTPMQIIIGCI